jgi:putative membrane protein
MKQQLSLTVTALFALAACSAIAQTDQANRMKLSADDSAFVTKALQGGMAEVELGNLAQQNGTSDVVKQFGKQMVEDHTKIGDELKSLATSKGVPVPTALDAKSQATKDRLSMLTGAEFDRAYMQEMLTDHQQDVAEFRRESTRATDPDIKAFAAKALPTLESHLKMARAGLAEVKKEK